MTSPPLFEDGHYPQGSGLDCHVPIIAKTSSKAEEDFPIPIIVTLHDTYRAYFKMRHDKCPACLVSTRKRRK